VNKKNYKKSNVNLINIRQKMRKINCSKKKYIYDTREIKDIIILIYIIYEYI